MGAFQEYARAAMAAGKKRGRRPTMNAQQFYPRGLERELQQKTVAEFMRIYGQFLEAALSGFSTFADEQLDLFESQPELSEKFKTELMEIARRTDSKAHENFSRQSEMIIGAPYYPPGTAEGVLNEWHATFQDLCKSACAQKKTRMAVIVAGAKQAGWNKHQLEKAIEKELPSQFKHRAELIARTELGKLNSRVTLETYKSTGIQYYKWLTTIDGRERESHAEMNDRICSVSDGGVYFDQNPERPLHPVEHQRTGSMYHGHPGTDFQCRCSMVMWDPEIDGDYEVKDSDLLEERKAAEKAEKEAQERAEAERIASEQAEREKAAEALKNAKEEACRAEAERNDVKSIKLNAVVEKQNKQIEALNRRLSSLFANERFPNETWKQERGVFVSKRRKEEALQGNGEGILRKELLTASIFAASGHSVYLIPERDANKFGEKHPDAVIDGEFGELKFITGKIKQIWERLKDASEKKAKIAVLETSRDYTVSDVLKMMKGKFIMAKKANTKYRYPFLFDGFYFISNDKEVHYISIKRIWEAL
ncbi:minor capsid protein [uncultured Fibrobacter sp.]|uniref:minor capsid protein n=1 Tax=uncultured Fibrobacter sp. TaxID=261512 RepID=UPI0025939E4F|nr:minor capsid protein [uncultured Fibrobacter sp.]